MSLVTLSLIPGLLMAALLVLSPPALGAADPWTRCVGVTEDIPPRPANAQDGSAFAGAVAGHEGPERDAAIRRALLDGNLPRFLRRAQPVTLAAPRPDGHAVPLTLCVLSNYLSVGSDDDFLRVPMGLDSALDVALALLPYRVLLVG